MKVYLQEFQQKKFEVAEGMSDAFNEQTKDAKIELLLEENRLLRILNVELMEKNARLSENNTLLERQLDRKSRIGF